MAQRTPSNAPAEAQQTASNENNIKYLVYGTKSICLMEPKWQSITSSTSFTIKLGTRQEQLACLEAEHAFFCGSLSEIQAFNLKG